MYIVRRKFIISEQQYDLYQKWNNYPQDDTPIEGEIIWRSLAAASDKLGEALRLVQMATQYSYEFEGLEEELINIAQDISCGSNRATDCGPEACDVLGKINAILQQGGYIKRDNQEKNTLNNQEMTEGEITERCWKGYTQKGMKTMFGKRYPNCVKKTKK
jgi:hypothetical protein